jgi:two-component system response regulator FixJ
MAAPNHKGAPGSERYAFMPRAATVYVVDDDPATRRALQAALERAHFRARTYPDAATFLQDFRGGGIGCLLLDLRLPAMSGIELFEKLRERKVRLPVIIISGHADVDSAVKTLKLGAVDLIQKPLDVKDVVERVREIIRRDTVRQQHHAAVQEIRRNLEKLTPREMVLVRLLIQGKSNKMIGATLGISIKTVANHRAHIMEKTQASNAADLVRMVLTVEQASMLDSALDRHYL